jgi:hypothetical protein
MTDDFDKELTVSLHKHAGAVPPRPNLAGAAIRRAHGIRRRRRIGAAVAAAAVVAIAVPVGLQAGDSLTRGDRTPAPVEQDERPDERQEREPTRVRLTVDLAELDAGDPPNVPYLDGTRLVVDGSAIDLGASAEEIYAITYAGDSAYFSERVNDNGDLELRSAPDAGVDGPVVGGPWGSPDGQYVAVLEQGSRIRAIDTLKGVEHEADLPPGQQLGSISFVGTTAFLFTNDPTAGTHTLLRWTFEDGELTEVDGVVRATALSPDGELVADMYKVDDLTVSTCTRVTSLTTGAVQWETCRHRIEGFSTDGRYVWGTQEYASGSGDTYNVVLDALTGEQVLRVDGPDSMDRPLLFYDSMFESATTLLIRAEQGGQAALVRCDLTTGECERATGLADVEFPYEGRTPYKLIGHG